MFASQPRLRLAGLAVSLVILFIPGVLLSEEPCILDKSKSSSLLACTEFKFYPSEFSGPDDLNEFQSMLLEKGWEGREGSQWRFPGHTDVLWLRFKIRNDQEDVREWILINEFAFSDSLKLFWVDGQKLQQDEQGLIRPWDDKHIDYRLPAFRLHIHPGTNYYFLKLQARSGKLLSLKLEAPGTLATRESYPGYLFPTFLTGGITAFVLSLFILISLKERIGLLYCIYVASMIVYMFSWEGYARQMLFPEHGVWTVAVLSSSGALAGWAVIALWRELLILSVHAPVINRIMQWIGAGYIVTAVYSLIPGADLRFVDVAIYILPALFIPLAIYSGIYAIRIGFRPALFTLIGFAGFLACIPFFFYAGMGWIPGSDWTRNPLYSGYLFEFAMFLISVGMRIHFLRNIQITNAMPVNNGDARTEKEKEAEPENAGPEAPSRLSRLNIAELSRKMDSLMKEEQLFCDEDLSQERLAGLLDIKRHQLSELLRVVYGTNFYAYINSNRVACARDLLISEPERSILSVALASGFNSKSTFNSEFKKQTGMTPGEFRKSRSETSIQAIT